MSEEGIIYSELKLSYPKKPKSKIQAAQNRKGFPWRIIAASLGIIICLLLVAVPALRYASPYKHQNNETQEHGNSSIRVENTCFSKVRSNPEKYKEAYKNKWLCCRKKCYYFSHSDGNFEENRKFCVNQSSHLVKIEAKDEQKFIQSLASYRHWIGLSRKGISSPWMWEDGSLMRYDFHLEDSNINNNCVYISSTKLTTALCNRPFFFICEKNSPKSNLKFDEDK